MNFTNSMNINVQNIDKTTLTTILEFLIEKKIQMPKVFWLYFYFVSNKTSF